MHEGSERMTVFFSPDNSLIGVIAQHFANGGRVWWNACWGDHTLAENPEYFRELSKTFGGAPIYYGPGLNRWSYNGLACQVGNYSKNKIIYPITYLDYQIYKP